MPFFDFHVHPGLKSRLAAAGTEPSPWQNIKVQLEVLKSIKINISPAFSDALDSQASLHQLWLGGVNLFGLIIHSLENHMAEGLLKKAIVRNGNVLQLDPVKLQESAAGNNYFRIAMTELERMEANSTAPASMGLPAGTELKIIRSISEYDRNSANVLHAILILEGSQNLFDNPDTPDYAEQFIRNLDAITAKYRLFAMNVCHFQKQPVANQAFAIQFLENGPFFPEDNGISEWGTTAIRELYKRNILVDIKHMSLQSRHDLYRLRMDDSITLPLICSHAGVTGISEMNRLDYFYNEPPINEGKVWLFHCLKKWGHVKDTAYNMISLNLYDEDIEQVIASGGMIGISLDQRILGFPADEPLKYKVGIPPTDLDCISVKETKSFFANRDPLNCPPRIENNTDVMSFDDAENQNDGFTTTLHAQYFLNQVIHILWVAKNGNKGITVAQAIKCICIGSDLDGLVNPIDCCMSTADYSKFKNQLLSMMNVKSFWKGTGFSHGELDIVTLLDGIFFFNAIAFLEKNFV